MRFRRIVNHHAADRSGRDKFAIDIKSLTIRAERKSHMIPRSGSRGPCVVEDRRAAGIEAAIRVQPGPVIPDSVRIVGGVLVRLAHQHAGVARVAEVCPTFRREIGWPQSGRIGHGKDGGIAVEREGAADEAGGVSAVGEIAAVRARAVEGIAIAGPPANQTCGRWQAIVGRRDALFDKVVGEIRIGFSRSDDPARRPVSASRARDQSEC